MSHRKSCTVVLVTIGENISGTATKSSPYEHILLSVSFSPSLVFRPFSSRRTLSIARSLLYGLSQCDAAATAVAAFPAVTLTLLPTVHYITPKHTLWLSLSHHNLCEEREILRRPYVVRANSLATRNSDCNYLLHLLLFSFLGISFWQRNNRNNAFHLLPQQNYFTYS